MDRRAFLFLLAGTRNLKADCVDLLQGFDKDPETFTAAGYTKPVYKIIHPNGPPVLFLHELPGLVPQAFDFARRLHSAGFSVYLPLFFGRAGDNSALRTLLSTPCWGSAFDCRSRHSLGAISNWIIEYNVALQERHGRVAVIGNCLTGAMPLVLMADARARRNLKAIVLSQPAVPVGPFGMPRSLDVRQSLGLTDPQLERAVRSGVPVLALQFDDDPFVPRERLEALQAAFKGRPFEYRSVPADQHCTRLMKGCKPPQHHHAVLTLGYCDDPDSNAFQAYKRVEQFLTQHLIGAAV